MRYNHRRGYTLVELIIAVGLFALIMTLAAGAYLIMINITRQTQGITSGIDNVSFALETITRTIRTSTRYGCYVTGTDCASGNSTFSVINSGGTTITYALDTTNHTITQTVGTGTPVPLTDSQISISSLQFYTKGVKAYTDATNPGDRTQARVVMLVSGTVTTGPGKFLNFNVETSATMRGTDI